MSESSPSHLAWQMFCLEKLAPASSSASIKVASRSEFLDRVRPQAIYNSSRPQAHPKKNPRGRKPASARRGAQEAASGGGVG